MFPKLSTSTCLLKERINADIKHEDHVRKVVARSNNKVYRPWKNKYCPKNAHTPFGDYPEHMVNSPLPKAQRNPIWQKSYASTDNSIKFLLMIKSFCLTDRKWQRRSTLQFESFSITASLLSAEMWSIEQKTDRTNPF